MCRLRNSMVAGEELYLIWRRGGRGDYAGNSEMNVTAIAQMHSYEMGAGRNPGIPGTGRRSTVNPGSRRALDPGRRLYP
ncbi:hypothetical protein JCM30471_05200 [Desulfuromonas carbonis]